MAKQIVKLVKATKKAKTAKAVAVVAAPTVKAKAPKLTEAQIEARNKARSAVREQVRNRVYSVYRKLAEQENVPVKPVLYFKPEAVTATKKSSNGNITRRMGALIAMALMAQGRKLKDGVSFSRRFKVGQDDVILENGCSGRLYVSGAVTLSKDTPGQEVFVVAKGTTQKLIKEFTQETLKGCGLL